MDNCLVCLEQSDDGSFRITSQCREWSVWNIQRILEKHLWWFYLKPHSQGNSDVQWICRRCWQEISSFNNFYCKVEQVHRHYEAIKKEYLHKSLSLKKQENVIVKNEIESKVVCEQQTVETTTTTNDINLAKERKPRCRPRKKLEEIPENAKYDMEKEQETVVTKTTTTNNINLAKERKPRGRPRKKIEGITENAKYDMEKEANNVIGFDTTNDDTVCNREENLTFDTLFIEVLNQNTDRFNSENDKPIKETKCQRNTKGKALKDNITLKTNDTINSILNEDFFKFADHKLCCYICNESLSDFSTLKTHYRKQHNARGYSMCCGNKYFKRCLLIDHLKLHADPNFLKCPSCTKTFATRRGLEMHLESHKNRERKYNCEECGKSYFNHNVYELHKLRHLPESKRNFKCNKCDKKFASDYLRQQHENVAHLKKYNKICDICGKTFNGSYSFLRHMNQHAGIVPTLDTCEICGVKLKNKYLLKQHIKMRHLEKNLQEQKCPYCSKISKNINAHRKHISYSHKMERKHACQLCDKAFKRPIELREHMSRHTGKILYTCPYCPRTFVSNANMHKHRKIAHRQEWEEYRAKKINGGGCALFAITDSVGPLPILKPIIIN